ncbi:hypothetical protein DICA1_F39282 [Diutina catenulata]
MIRTAQIARLFRRHRSALAEIQSVEAYMDYCATKRVNLASTVFKGTLYELQCKEFLHQKLNCFHLIRVGGCYDNGIDIIGKWNLQHYFDKLKSPPPARSTSVLRYVKDLDAINILVQCKNIGTKISARVVRELAGIYDFNVKRTAKQLRTNYLFLFSPHPLSPQAMTQLCTTNVPMIHVQLRVSAMGTKTIGGIYMNPMASKHLHGLNLELEFRQVLGKDVF